MLDPPDPTDAVWVFPSQLLTVEVLRRPIESTQYTSGDYTTLADDLEVTLSTGRTGQCWDNALAESFFAALKGECLEQQPWPTRTAARRATVEYIAWYNGTRLHSALGYRTPDEFETATDQESIKQVARPSHQPCPSDRGNPNWPHTPRRLTPTTFPSTWAKPGLSRPQSIAPGTPGGPVPRLGRAATSTSTPPCSRDTERASLPQLVREPPAAAGR